MWETLRVTSATVRRVVLDPGVVTPSQLGSRTTGWGTMTQGEWGSRPPIQATLRFTAPPPLSRASSQVVPDSGVTTPSDLGSRPPGWGNPRRLPRANFPLVPGRDPPGGVVTPQVGSRPPT